MNVTNVWNLRCECCFPHSKAKRELGLWGIEGLSLKYASDELRGESQTFEIRLDANCVVIEFKTLVRGFGGCADLVDTSIYLVSNLKFCHLPIVGIMIIPNHDRSFWNATYPWTQSFRTVQGISLWIKMIKWDASLSCQEAIESLLWQPLETAGKRWSLQSESPNSQRSPNMIVMIGTRTAVASSSMKKLGPGLDQSFKIVFCCLLGKVHLDLSPTRWKGASARMMLRVEGFAPLGSKASELQRDPEIVLMAVRQASPVWGLESSGFVDALNRKDLHLALKARAMPWFANPPFSSDFEGVINLANPSELRHYGWDLFCVAFARFPCFGSHF